MSDNYGSTMHQKLLFEYNSSTKYVLAKLKCPCFCLALFLNMHDVKILLKLCNQMPFFF